MEEPLALEGIRNVAKAIAPDQVIAGLAVDQTAIEYGDPITLTGTFTTKDKSPLANVSIRVEGKSLGESSWRLLTTATTDISGKFVKPLLLGKATTLRIFSEGTWERGEGISNEVPITMTRLLYINAPASAKKNESISITGSIRPRTVGTFIQLERLFGGKWQPFGAVLTTDAQGNFSLPVTAQGKGVLTLRINVAAEASWPITTSAPFSILIRSAGTSELVK
jgi:hypothetical protein